MGNGIHFQQFNGGCTDEKEVIIIYSVEPGNHTLFDRKEEEWIHGLRTMDYMKQGGMNVRNDLKRILRGQYVNESFAKVDKYFVCVSAQPVLVDFDID